MSSRPFLINIGSLRRNIGETTKERCVGHLSIVISETSVVPDAEVVADVELRSIIGGINVKGLVSAPFVTECRRCLTEVRDEIVSQVDELFTPEGDGDETYRFEDDEVDIEPLARDTVALALPIATLCREGCKGLCPNCGTNWNEAECECEFDLRDPRWAALDKLTDES